MEGTGSQSLRYLPLTATTVYTMNISLKNCGRRILIFVAALLLMANSGTGAPLRAAPPAARFVGSSLTPLAADSEGFSIKRFLSGLNRRERVLQFCVGVMCLALFILCKKLGADRRI